MTILVTGGFGLVGRAVVGELLAAGHCVRVFDAARRAARKPPRSLEIVYGDLCNIAHVGEAARDVGAVVHLGALIPPVCDRTPIAADYVNRGGTANLVHAVEERSPGARFVFASSIAVYGDRRHTAEITSTDPPNPGTDPYANQKLAAEALVQQSRLPWVILRLTYVASPDKLRTDPLMFRMPLDTDLEICTTGDVARAFAAAVSKPAAVGRILDIAGGRACRTNYREYVGTILGMFGFSTPLPEAAFSTGPFHCGFVDTGESEALLHYQRETLADHYEAVALRTRLKRMLLKAAPMLRHAIRRRLLRSSPFYPTPHPMG